MQPASRHLPDPSCLSLSPHSFPISHLSAFLATPPPRLCPSLLARALLTGGLFQHLWAELWFGAIWVIPDPYTSPGWVGWGLESRLNDTQKGTKTPQLWGPRQALQPADLGSSPNNSL